MNTQIYIFYHLFCVNNWKEIFAYHLNCIKDSKLYDNSSKLLVGVNYITDYSLHEISHLAKEYGKIDIFHCRKALDLPVTVWKDPEVTIHCSLGEGESILKMTEYVKKNKLIDAYCLFLHSKGVTKPDDRSRSQIEHFYKKGLSKKALQKETQDFILIDMAQEILSKWRSKVEMLETYSFYYYIWNFFWIKGQLLYDFDFQLFNSKAEFPKKYGLNNRHYTAIFPLNLYEAVFSTPIKDKRMRIGYYK